MDARRAYGPEYVNGDGVRAQLCTPLLAYPDKRKSSDPGYYRWSAFLFVGEDAVAIVEPTPAEKFDWPNIDRAEAARIGDLALTALGFSKVEPQPAA